MVIVCTLTLADQPRLVCFLPSLFLLSLSCCSPLTFVARCRDGPGTCACLLLLFRGSRRKSLLLICVCISLTCHGSPPIPPSHYLQLCHIHAFSYFSFHPCLSCSRLFSQKPMSVKKDIRPLCCALPASRFTVLVLCCCLKHLHFVRLSLQTYSPGTLASTAFTEFPSTVVPFFLFWNLMPRSHWRLLSVEDLSVTPKFDNCIIKCYERVLCPPRSWIPSSLVLCFGEPRTVIGSSFEQFTLQPEFFLPGPPFLCPCARSRCG